MEFSRIVVTLKHSAMVDIFFFTQGNHEVTLDFRQW